MVDKSKTIKEASDKELEDLLIRLGREREVQMLISDLIRNSTPTPDGVGIYRPIVVSTEASVESMYHVGTKGMRWGVRSARGSRGGHGGKLKKQVSEDAKTAHKNLKRPARELSTKELQMLTKRMQLEKQYKDIKPSDIKKGMTIVKTILAVGTTVNALYSLSQSPAGQPLVKKLGIKKLIKVTTP